MAADKHINDFPDEVFYSIFAYRRGPVKNFTYTAISRLVTLAAVCRRWRRLAQDEMLWREIHTEDTILMLTLLKHGFRMELTLLRQKGNTLSDVVVRATHLPAAVRVVGRLQDLACGARVTDLRLAKNGPKIKEEWSFADVRAVECDWQLSGNKNLEAVLDRVPLDRVESFTCGFAMGFVQRLPQLTHLTTLKLSPVAVSCLPRILELLPPTLTTLSMSLFHSDTAETPPLKHVLPSVTCLALGLEYDTARENLDQLAAVFPSVTSLSYWASPPNKPVYCPFERVTHLSVLFSNQTDFSDLSPTLTLEQLAVSIGPNVPYRISPRVNVRTILVRMHWLTAEVATTLLSEAPLATHVMLFEKLRSADMGALEQGVAAANAAAAAAAAGVDGGAVRGGAWRIAHVTRTPGGWKGETCGPEVAVIRE